MKKLEKAMTVAVIAVVCGGIIAFCVYVIFGLFGNPLERKNVKNIAQEYVDENYSEMNPVIVDIDYNEQSLEGPYQVEIYLEKTDKTFWLCYYSSGELGWDTYDYSIYEEKYGEIYFEEGLYAIRDIIGTPQNEKQKAVLAVINFDFEIQNGGLCQYLVNEDNDNIVKITDYLRMVGTEEQAKLLETFTAENGIELKSVETNNADDFLEFEKSKPFDEFDRAYMDIYTPDEEWGPDFNGQIVSYIQDNIEDF
ncbi:MAG: DUF4375 domain-containing protein [Clostridia bacterium]|nr:DUF4375 domain-containing protein [Clostridia bacterium]